MAGINPQILKWARESAGYDLDEAARRVGIGDTKATIAADRLAAYEAGETVPSLPLLRRMALQYRRPLLTFYLAQVPALDETGEDFRTLPERSDPSNVLLSTLLRDVKARQSLVRDVIEEDEDTERVEFVGSKSRNDPVPDVATALALDIHFDKVAYRNRRTQEEAFDYIRGCAERAGIFVLLAGDLGSWQTAIEVEIFRGFALADDLAPFVVINDQDAKVAWSFTLLHELAHLWIGASGVSGAVTTDGVEQFCNDVAAAILVSPDEIQDVPLTGTNADRVVISRLANTWKVSRAMITYQIYRHGRISRDRWEELRETFYGEWRAERAAQKAANRASEGGPNWYVIKRHRVGNALLSVARRAMAEGNLTPTRAARMLGVKPMSVYPLLAAPARRPRVA